MKLEHKDYLILVILRYLPLRIISFGFIWVNVYGYSTESLRETMSKLSTEGLIVISFDKYKQSSDDFPISITSKGIDSLKSIDLINILFYDDQEYLSSNIFYSVLKSIVECGNVTIPNALFLLTRSYIMYNNYNYITRLVGKIVK